MMGGHAKLLTAIRSALAPFAIPGTQIQVEGLRSRPWASATFVGEQHSLELLIDDRTHEVDRSAQLVAAMTHHLEQADLDVPGHVLVEFALAEAQTRRAESHEGTHVRVLFDALTIED